MNGTYNILQKNAEQENMRSFQNAISSFRLDLAKDVVNASNETDVKELALDIVSSAKEMDLESKNILADVIEAWSINLSSMTWLEELRHFCEKNQDIQSVYSVDFLCKKQLLIIVDDMASDKVLDYNGFAFDLRNRYKEIKDFMVIDRESYNCLKNEFEKCDEVYRRG